MSNVFPHGRSAPFRACHRWSGRRPHRLDLGFSDSCLVHSGSSLCVPELVAFSPWLLLKYTPPILPRRRLDPAPRASVSLVVMLSVIQCVCLWGCCAGWMAQGGGQGHPHGYEGRGIGGHMGPVMPPFGGGMRGMHPMAAMAKMQEVLTAFLLPSPSPFAGGRAFALSRPPPAAGLR